MKDRVSESCQDWLNQVYAYFPDIDPLRAIAKLIDGSRAEGVSKPGDAGQPYREANIRLCRAYSAELRRQYKGATLGLN